MMDNVELVVGAIIGRGGFADVRLGTYGGSQVAIKVCRLPFSLSYSEQMKRCMKEASLLKSVCHNNVLRYINIRKNDDLREVFLITEYIEGGSMERFCGKERLPLPDNDKKCIACSCWRGLAFLHEEHIFHKDIKPENILISKDLESVKIADFGLSETKNMCSTYSTNTLEGTAMYLPPELASPGDKKRYRRNPEKSDVYSMGVTLCEFFSGQPFWTYGYKPLDNFQVMYKLVEQCQFVKDQKKPIDPSCWPNISVEIQNVLIHAINADYAKRKSANEMLVLFEDVSVVSPILLPFVNDTDIMEDGSGQERIPGTPQQQSKQLSLRIQEVLQALKSAKTEQETQSIIKRVYKDPQLLQAFIQIRNSTYPLAKHAVQKRLLPLVNDTDIMEDGSGQERIPGAPQQQSKQLNLRIREVLQALKNAETEQETQSIIKSLHKDPQLMQAFIQIRNLTLPQFSAARKTCRPIKRRL